MCPPTSISTTSSSNASRNSKESTRPVSLAARSGLRRSTEKERQKYTWFHRESLARITDEKMPPLAPTWCLHHAMDPKSRSLRSCLQKSVQYSEPVGCRGSAAADRVLAARMDPLRRSRALSGLESCAQHQRHFHW